MKKQFLCLCILYTTSLFYHALAAKQFTVYPVGFPGTGDIFYLTSSHCYKKVHFLPGERSISHLFQTPSLQFFKQEISPDNEIAYQIIDKIEIPSSTQNLFLIFLKSSKENSGYKIHFLSDDRTETPFNSLTFFNAVGYPLTGKFGEQKLSLGKGNSKVIRLDDQLPENITVELHMRSKGGLIKVLHNKWSFYPNYRHLIMLLPPSTPKTNRIQAIRLSQHSDEVQEMAGSNEKTHR